MGEARGFSRGAQILSRNKKLMSILKWEERKTQEAETWLRSERYKGRPAVKQVYR